MSAFVNSFSQEPKVLFCSGINFLQTFLPTSKNKEKTDISFAPNYLRGEAFSSPPFILTDTQNGMWTFNSDFLPACPNKKQAIKLQMFWNQVEKDTAHYLEIQMLFLLKLYNFFSTLEKHNEYH